MSNLTLYQIRGRRVLLHAECSAGFEADRDAGLIYGPYRKPSGGMYLDAETMSLCERVCPYCGKGEPRAVSTDHDQP